MTFGLILNFGSLSGAAPLTVEGQVVHGVPVNALADSGAIDADSSRAHQSHDAVNDGGRNPAQNKVQVKPKNNAVHPAPGGLIASRVLLGSAGSVTPRPLIRASIQVSSTSVCWNNSNTVGVPGVFAAGDEVVDWGVKACLLTEVVRGFEVGYRTSALSTSAGGPGAAFTVSFYEDKAGAGVLGREVARYALTGMPASVIAGSATNHTVLVDLGDQPFCLSDGEIGYGYTSDDGITNPLLTFAPNANLGTLNLLDRYSPGPASMGTFVETFNLGPGTSTASLYMRITEDLGTLKASSTIVNGSGVNPSLLTEITPAVLGTPWITAIDFSGHPNANFSLLVVTSLPPLVASTNLGELLIDLTDPGAIATLSFGLHSLGIPKDTFILGKTFHSQGAIFDSLAGPILLNGIDVVPGF